MFKNKRCIVSRKITGSKPLDQCHIQVGDTLYRTTSSLNSIAKVILKMINDKLETPVVDVALVVHGTELQISVSTTTKNRARVLWALKGIRFKALVQFYLAA